MLQRMSLFSLLQVARQLQPSVVYVGDTERTFVKKIPKTDKVTGPSLVFCLLEPDWLSSECFLKPKPVKRTNLTNHSKCK